MDRVQCIGHLQKFLFLLAFEIDFTGLNDLDLDADVDETKTSPFDSNEIDEEPEWHALDNFIETIIKNMLSVILATPGGMLIGLVLWVIYIHFTNFSCFSLCLQCVRTILH